LHEPQNPHFAEHDIPDTEVISVAPPAPVFVDSTGRRSRLLRRLAYAFGALVMVYGGLISVSLAGGPVRSGAVLPLPGLEPKTGDDRAERRPDPTPAPTPSQSPTRLFITDAMPRRTSAPRPLEPRIESARIATTRPAARPSRTRKTTAPKPAVTTTRPLESTTTAPTTTPVTTTPTTTPGPNPVPPAPPAGGGQGGGAPVGIPAPIIQAPITPDRAESTPDSGDEPGPTPTSTGTPEPTATA
jgi:hypothetical protein